MEASETRLSTGTLSVRTKIGLIAACFLLATVLFYVLELKRTDWAQVTGYWSCLLLVMISSLIAVVLHEGLHALFFKIFGGAVTFGVKWTKLGPAFYTTSPKSFTIGRYKITGLAPQILTIISLILGLTVPSTVLSLAFIVIAIMNIGGGCFDIYAVIWLRKFPKECLVQDTRDGLNVIVVR